MFRMTGERADGNVVFEPPDGRRGTFLSQPLIDVRRGQQTITFTWGEGNDAVRCALPWDGEKKSFRGECVTSDDKPAAALEFIPLSQPAEQPDADAKADPPTGPARDVLPR
ncbi:MAG TPA: hypothetical protein VKB50_10725 [Vicinamibacterales bacterium]|nr:hypothetical protein [Vicinamibacterales bacterium]